MTAKDLKALMDKFPGFVYRKMNYLGMPAIGKYKGYFLLRLTKTEVSGYLVWNPEAEPGKKITMVDVAQQPEDTINPKDRSQIVKADLSLPITWAIPLHDQDYFAYKEGCKKVLGPASDLEGILTLIMTQDNNDGRADPQSSQECERTDPS